MKQKGFWCFAVQVPIFVYFVWQKHMQKQQTELTSINLNEYEMLILDIKKMFFFVFIFMR